MLPIPRPRVFLSLFSLTSVFYASWSLFSSDERALSYTHSLFDSLDYLKPSSPELPSVPWISEPNTPDITLIAIWNPRVDSKPQAYLPNFFASVEANAPRVSLLFVVYDKHGYGCGPDRRISPVGIENVREICFTPEDYWQLHADYLCAEEHWGCSKKQKQAVLELLMDRGEDDFLNSYFRPFRGGVFSKWIAPRTSLWGWCDMDVMLGSFARKFPWHLIGQFDLIVPAMPYDTEDVMVFMSGHLLFVRNEASVMEEFFNFPALRTSETFLATPRKWIDPGAEEADYSHFAMLNPNLTFIHFSSLTWTQHHIATIDSGVWALDHGAALGAPSIASHSTSPNPATQSLRTYLARLLPHPSSRTPPLDFTREGGEYNIDLIGGSPNQEAWIPPDLIVHYQPNYDAEIYSRVRRDSGTRAVMRRAPYGPITERVEPTRYIVTRPLDEVDFEKGLLQGAPEYNRDTRPYLIEYLYTHFQHEKYSSWFDMPAEALKEGELLYVSKDEGAERWDANGRVTWSVWDKPKLQGE